jgi:glycosyltransferase involved in cell wall biosynthesis
VSTPLGLKGKVIGYLINQYPKVSHTFIRREIRALEQQGFVIHRFAHRGWDIPIVEREDEYEREATVYLLREGLIPLIIASLLALTTAPKRFVRGMLLAWSFSRRSDGSVLLHLAYLGQACLLLRLMRKRSVAHLHVHFGTNAAEVATLARALGGPPYSLTIHGSEEFDKPEALHLRTKVEYAAFVAVISSFGLSQLYRWIPHREWSKVHVIPCGLEFDRRENDHIQTGISSRRFVFVGRICKEKGLLKLIEAARILAERGVDYEIVLAGDGEMRSEIESNIQHHGLGSKIRITGWISNSEVQRQIAAARIFILPSFAEGLPVVIMEAMALRRPVISTFVGGIPELVIDGRTGWLVPAGDEQALATAMEASLSATHGFLERMGLEARERVTARHNIQSSAKMLASLFS